MTTVQRTSAESVQVSLVREERVLWDLRDEWTDLLAASASDTLFLTWEWLTVWWRFFGRNKQLHVLIARDARGQLVGAAPLWRRSHPLAPLVPAVVEFIGYGGDVTPEYLDFIVRPGFEPAVNEEFARHLCRDEAVDGICLRPLAGHSPNKDLLTQALSRHAGEVVCTHDSICPVFPLPATLEDFATTRSRNYRKKVGEYERRCRDKLGLQLRLSATAEDLQRDMAMLADLHQRRWKGMSTAFASSRYTGFHMALVQEMHRHSWVRLFSLEAANVPVAMFYGFSYRDRWYFYQSGRNPRYDEHRVGLVLMHRVIQEAIGEKAKTFDFLRGEEAYKYRWATGHVTNVRLVCCKSSAARIGHRIVDALRSFRRQDLKRWMYRP